MVTALDMCDIHCSRYTPVDYAALCEITRVHSRGMFIFSNLRCRMEVHRVRWFDFTIFVTFGGIRHRQLRH